MAEQNEQQPGNPFGDSPSAAPLNTPPLNQQGSEPTLGDILDAIRAKQDAVPPKQEDTPVVPEKVATGDPVSDADINTGSKALDLAVKSFIKSSGATQADLERATALAIEQGDAKFIDRAFLRERFGDNAEDAIALAEAVLDQANVGKQQLVDSVYNAAGGKEQWESALAVYKELATPGLQKILKTMFDSGDAAAVKEAAELVVEYAKNSGAITKGGNRVTASQSASGAQGISAAEMTAAINKLNPSSRNYAADYTRLIELRKLGKSLGK
jgi:hypothetical protein